MLRHSIIYFIGKLVPAIISLISIMVYTRIISPEEYGFFSIIIVTAGLLNILCFQWIRSSLLRFRPSDKDSMLFWGTLIGQMIIVSLIVLVFISLFILLDFTKLSKSILIVIFIILILNAVNDFLLTYFRSSLKPNIVIITTVANSIATLTISYALLLLNFGTAGLIIGVISGLLISIFIFLFNLRKKITRDKINFKFSQVNSKKFLIYGLPISLSFTLGIALQNIDKYMITLVLGIKENGIYSVTYDLIHNVIYMIMTSVSLAGFPIVLNTIKNHGEVKGKIQFYKYVKLLLFISIPSVMGLIAIKENFILVFIGEKFTFKGSLLSLIAIASFFHGIKSYYFDQALQISSKTKYFFIPALVAIICNIGLNFLLLPMYGINGAAIATLISFLISMLLSYFYSSKAYDIKIPCKELSKILFSTIVMTVVIQNIEFKSDILSIIVKVIIGIIVYLLMSLFSNTLNIRTQLKEKLF